MVLVVRDGNIGAKLKFDVSTMNDFVKNIEVPPKLGLVHQKSFERIVGQAYSFNPDLSGDPVWFMKLSRMLEPDEGYVIEGSAVFICQIQHHGPCDKVSTEIAEFTEVISSEKEDDIFGSILKRADSSVSQPIEEVFSRDAAWIQSTMNEVCSYLESIVAKDFLSVVRNSFGCDLDRVADSLPPLINSTKVSQQLIIDLLLNLLVGCCEAEYVRKLEDSDIPEKDVAHPPSETFGIALLKMNHFHDLKLGKTKVFLRAGQIEVLDSQRAEVLVRLDTAAKCIRGRLRTYVARRDFLSTRVAAVSLQACCRGYLARKRYSEKREASSAISIQKYVRRWLLVDAYTKLRFSTLLIQSSIRGFLARQSFTQRNEHKAAMLIQSHWRMCKVRSAFRHRQVNIIAIQCLWRQKLAKRELWRLKKMGRSAGFNLGGTYSLHRPQQHAPSVSSSGVPFSSVNNHDLLHLHGSDMFQSSHSSYHSQTSGPPGIGLRPLNSPNTVSGMGSYDQLIQQYQQHQNQSQFQLQQMPGLNQSHRDQGVKSMQSAQAAPDSFGLLGLFRMSDPDLTSLALGIDLTTLGLNLNSTENLHKTFGSPWSDDPAKGDPEFVVPQCYYAKQPPALSQSHFLKFPMDTLFYIFYSMPKDEAQLYAANELYNRGWFYHRELRQWLTRVPNMEPLVKTNTYERGSYICFDPNTWEKIRKDNFIVHYEMLEKRPNRPQH